MLLSVWDKGGSIIPNNAGLGKEKIRLFQAGKIFNSRNGGLAGNLHKLPDKDQPTAINGLLPVESRNFVPGSRDW